MTAYVVVVENMRTGLRKVSQEGYKTIFQAQVFCLGRSRTTKKHHEHLFYDGENRYEIVEVKII